MPSMRFVPGDPAHIDTDLLVVPMFDGEPIAAALPALDAASGGEIARAAATGEIRGRLYDLFVTPGSGRGWKSGRIAVIGAGKAGEFTTDRLRKAAAAAAIAARQRRIARVAFLLRGALPPVHAVQAAAEGLMLSAFSVDRYKSGERLGPPPTELTVAAAGDVDDQAALADAVERGRILGEASNLARAFANEPSNLLTPRLFAERGAAAAREAGLGV